MTVSSGGDISLQSYKRQDRLGPTGIRSRSLALSYYIQHCTEVFLHGPLCGAQHPPSTVGDGKGQRCEKHALAGGKAKTHIPVGRTSKPRCLSQCLRGKWGDSDFQRWLSGRVTWGALQNRAAQAAPQTSQTRISKSGPRLQCGWPLSCRRPLTRGFFPSCQQTI